jgi:hypothetical protein
MLMLGLAPTSSMLPSGPSTPTNRAFQTSAGAITASMFTMQPGGSAAPTPTPTPVLPPISVPGVTAPASSAPAPSGFLCADGVTQVNDPSLCPQAAPPGPPGMQITAAPPPGIVAPAPTAPAVFMCPDGVTQTTDPTLMSCPVVTPTILGINQSAFIWGAVLVAAGLGAFLLLRGRAA